MQAPASHVSELRLDLVGGPPAVAEHAMIRDCLPTLMRAPLCHVDRHVRRLERLAP